MGWPGERVLTVSGCAFCGFVAGLGPATAYQSDDYVVFMGRYQPTGPGYSLVIPTEHMQDLGALSPDRLGPTLALVQAVSTAVMGAFSATGTTIMQNNGEPGQSVPHLHFHVIPRRHGDGYPCTSDIEVPSKSWIAKRSRYEST